MGNETELWLVRHGETEWSAANKHTSRTDVMLTARGCERAAALGKYLAGTKFCAVMRSPMKRARKTCEIAGFGERAVVDDGLREWDYGVYEGRTTAEIQQEIPGVVGVEGPDCGRRDAGACRGAGGWSNCAGVGGDGCRWRAHISESRPFDGLRTDCGVPDG